MKRLILAAGVAALAITAPAASQPGERGGGKDRRAEVQKQRGGDKARAQRAERRAQAQERRGQSAQRTERRAQAQERRDQRGERAQAQERRVQRAERAQVQDRRAQRVERAQIQDRRAQRAERPQRVREQRVAGRDSVRKGRNRQLDRLERTTELRDRRFERMAERRDIRVDRIANREDRRLARLAETRVVPLSDWRELARGGVWLDGCPPGLAKKPVPCMPPGQVRNVVGQPLSTLRQRVELRELPNRLRYVYGDTDDYYYRYGNGYLYQVNRGDDLVRALLPLFGLGLTVGQPFPTSYPNYYLPTGLQPFYASSPYTDYRYANGYVYQIDPMTGMIVDVDPMLGYGYGYGQMMPVTYSAYNVPYQYRPLYYDTSDHYYRYAPGAIYQVDPQTSLITAVAALLTGGMTVGQPLPTGYGAYNLPYGYRTQYYDTPNDWYRYSNGYIYRVDPATQLVTAIVASVLT